MARTSPLLKQHHDREAVTAEYGPGVEVVQTFGEIDLEYAAVRKGAGLIDLPQRAVVQVSGGDGPDFLNRMLTQELKGFEAGQCRQAFWLSRKGRIDADLFLVRTANLILVDVDVHAAARVVEGLGSYIISEDAAISDVTEAWHRLGLHGPEALAVLAAASGSGDVAGLGPLGAVEITIGGERVLVARRDMTGDPGAELFVPASGASAVYGALMKLGAEHLRGAEDEAFTHVKGEFHLREIGWAAFNVARIEGGSPIYLLDYGPESLPHESGVLSSRVSFTKGCYLGQEIVARIQSLGSPKQKVVAVRIDDKPGERGPTVGEEQQPECGAAVLTAAAGGASAEAEPDVIGGVTSSAVSPMLGGAAICFATVKSKFSAAGTRVLVEVEGRGLPGTVGANLALWTRSAATGVAG